MQMDGRVIKVSISLPPESVAQLEYLVKAWHMPPTVKRSQIIQHAIWQAYTDALARADSAPVLSNNDDDYYII